MAVDCLPKATRADVLRIVQRDFRPEDREEVLTLLDRYDEGPEPEGAARIHLAILKLSAGNVGAVQTHVELARTDFRDVITAAEYPEFAKVGFVGIDRMTPEDVRLLQARDWQQYLEWLTRA